MAMHLCLLGDASSVHVRRWAAEMAARGHRVSLVTARPQDLPGVEQRLLSPVARSADWLLRVGQARGHLDALAPDVVHAHYVTSYGYLAARCASRRPTVMTAWGSDILVTPKRNPWMRWLTGWTLRRADLITGDSQDLVDEIRRYGPTGPVSLVHWGADLGRFRPVPWAGKRGFQVVSLRSWGGNYNIDVIVEAVHLLVRRRPDAGVHLHLLGGGPLEGDLRRQVDRLGLRGHVTMHGQVGEAEMAAVLGASKVSVSVPSSDATSVSVLESMACGLPVLASDLSANRAWLDAACLVPPRDPQALMARLDALLLDDAAAERAGQANLERMRRDGARSVQMDAMDRLYARLLARAGGPAPLHTDAAGPDRGAG